jgi:hypothetical protein
MRGFCWGAKWRALTFSSGLKACTRQGKEASEWKVRLKSVTLLVYCWMMVDWYVQPELHKYGNARMRSICYILGLVKVLSLFNEFHYTVWSQQLLSHMGEVVKRVFALLLRHDPWDMTQDHSVIYRFIVRHKEDRVFPCTFLIWSAGCNTKVLTLSWVLFLADKIWLTPTFSNSSVCLLATFLTCKICNQILYTYFFTFEKQLKIYLVKSLTLYTVFHKSSQVAH